MNATGLYLDLLKQVLTRHGFDDYVRVRGTGWKRHILNPMQRLIGSRGYELMLPLDTNNRVEGRDWPGSGETMIGLKRLDSLQSCIETVITDNIPGDLIETGVWRGGATIFMRAVLAAHGVADRTVWVADSFRGLPPPEHAADAGGILHTYDRLAISLEEVQRNFDRYGLLDEQVRFLEGWFADTLPDAPIERLAIVRLDGDMYASTQDAITALYPRLSPGGFLIVDDFAIRECREAIEDYRAQHGIADPIQMIDWTGAFWRKS